MSINNKFTHKSNEDCYICPKCLKIANHNDIVFGIVRIINVESSNDNKNQYKYVIQIDKNEYLKPDIGILKKCKWSYLKKNISKWWKFWWMLWKNYKNKNLQ